MKKQIEIKKCYNNSNKRIAEFMGYTVYSITTTIIPAAMNHIRVDSLSYHSNWNRLMDVVEKMESLGYISTIEKLQHGEHRVFFNKIETLEEVGNGARDMDKKLAVYKAVVNFIDWYNNKL